MKTCLFRWTNTAIVVLITTPFTSRLSLPSTDSCTSFFTEEANISDTFVENIKAYLANSNNTSSLLGSIYPIFIIEMIHVPLVSVTDVFGHWKLHVLGPRAINRKRLFSYFQGESYDIGERYTVRFNSFLFLYNVLIGFFPHYFRI